jgi:hypothetical protein
MKVNLSLTLGLAYHGVMNFEGLTIALRIIELLRHVGTACGTRGDSGSALGLWILFELGVRRLGEPTSK